MGRPVRVVKIFPGNRVETKQVLRKSNRLQATRLQRTLRASLFIVCARTLPWTRGTTPPRLYLFVFLPKTCIVRNILNFHALKLCMNMEDYFRCVPSAVQRNGTRLDLATC
ncbi:hypothetical protein B5X24_HaOG207342 [Helicoverpa armigera]|uniref:Uncharacterized protein n=1 Tax=Helicoverpa armigera TaxID=29058 RepID=A0A2W1BSG3_HELAM|nr:hypothetical protein B5X24_HaOG207342 [Helicoverpa armigera]